MRKNITIHELAKKLNVSASTVSRALNNHHSISEITAANIRKEASKLGYRPNALAVALRKNKSNIIGILVNDITDYFNYNLVSKIEEILNCRGYTIMILQCLDNLIDEEENAKLLRAHNISGLIIVLGTKLSNVKNYEIFKDEETPLILISQECLSIKSLTIQVDNFIAARRVVNHFLKEGFSKLAFLSDSKELLLRNQKYDGFIKGLIDNGYEVEDSRIIKVDSCSQSSAYKSFEKLWKSSFRPDAIFCTDDYCALGVMQYAKENNIKIPEDLSIVGCNNSDFTSIVEPPLSTLSYPSQEIGELASTLIIDWIEGKKVFNKLNLKIVVESIFIVRQSSKIST